MRTSRSLSPPRPGATLRIAATYQRSLRSSGIPRRFGTRLAVVRRGASPPRPASLAAMSCRNYFRSARVIPTSSSRCWSPSGPAISSKKVSTSPFVVGAWTLALSRARSASPPSLPSQRPQSIQRRAGLRPGDLDRHDGVIFVSEWTATLTSLAALGSYPIRRRPRFLQQ